ncbi:hypothetical protein PsorP6_009790 [Peronosclerospora sorghi]|uniref:Uncharacterized protein n=1 Tax=Peronosclerospora sorghi TaxID=230839 RepID=A0ACC0W022_9STRA|nr:hypothetical protein PsorP6_009790 [Peronosclerospora sorghi]
MYRTKTSDTYKQALDVSYQAPSNDGIARVDQRVQFPSDKVRYCFHGDTACKQCRNGVFKDVIQGNRTDSLTKFCYGAKGCVCIAICEAPQWKTTVGQTVCNGTTLHLKHESESVHATPTHHAHHLETILAGVLGGLAAGIVLVAAIVYLRHRRLAAAPTGSSGSRRDATDDAAASPTPGPSSTLSLFGWHAMQSELIEREHLLLAGVSDFSTVRSGYLQLLNVDASAPPLEERDASSAPTLLPSLAGSSAPSLLPSRTDGRIDVPSAPLESPASTSGSSKVMEEDEERGNESV